MKKNIFINLFLFFNIFKILSSEKDEQINIKIINGSNQKIEVVFSNGLLDKKTDEMINPNGNKYSMYLKPKGVYTFTHRVLSKTEFFSSKICVYLAGANFTIDSEERESYIILYKESCKAEMCCEKDFVEQGE